MDWEIKIRCLTGIIALQFLLECALRGGGGGGGA